MFHTSCSTLLGGMAVLLRALIFARSRGKPSIGNLLKLIVYSKWNESEIY